MSVKPTKEEEHKAANTLTRTSVPSVGGLEAMAAAAETEATLDHGKVVAATAHMAAFRPTEIMSDAEVTADVGVISRYSILETAATAIAARARAGIAALVNAARTAAATPQLTRR